LGALAVIFVPMIVIGPETKGAPDAANLGVEVPEAPDGDFITREISMGPPVATPTPSVDGVIAADPADPNALATVDAAAGTAPRVDALESTTAVAVDAATGLPMPVAATPSPAPAETPPAPVAVSTPTPTPVVTPTPAPAPPPPPAAVAAGDYEVTAGSFGNRTNADALVARLKSSGLPAYTETVQINGQPGTRVKVGPFADRAAAEAARVRTAAISGSAAVATSNAEAPVRSASTAPRAAEVAPRASVSGSGFAVQLGAFSSESDAQALVTRAKAAGFSAFEQRVPTANGVLWRVRLGPMADRSAAERLQTDAAGKLGVSGIVVPHP
jgi:DedD protein